MGFARTHSAAVLGVRAHIVEVEAHVSSGLPGFAIVGLPDTSLSEAKDRVRAAVMNSGLSWPQTKITVGLSPAWFPKRGSGLDVAIALAILAANERPDLEAELVRQLVALGELGLDGRIRPVMGGLAAALAIREAATAGTVSGEVICSVEDSLQLRVVPGIQAMPAATLRALVAQLRGEEYADFSNLAALPSGEDSQSALGNPAQNRLLDLADVLGQGEAKAALEIAAAGGHHLALLGRAGVGKTLLAERLPGLLPDLPDDHSLDVTSIHQLAGWQGNQLIRRPPWAAPHHTATRTAVVGGGSDDRPTIGMTSLAHRGVLFLDEAAEFQPATLDALRQPIEHGYVRISRAGFNLELPAGFQLVLATNPCPCGNALDSKSSPRCTCSAPMRRKYLARLSGPMMDRMDLRVVLHRPTNSELAGLSGIGEASSVVAARVLEARDRALRRFDSTPWRTICQVPTEELLRRWPLPAESSQELDRACARDSIRGRDRVIRVAWTVADLAGHDSPQPGDVEKAVHLRSTEPTWAAA